MSRFELILLCLCMGACTASMPPVDPLTLAGLSESDYELIGTGEDFARRVVNETLSGAGYRAKVKPGGTLDGLYQGQPFQGTWTFTKDGRYCQSFTATLAGPTFGCYWVAAGADDIRLIPVPAG